MPLFIHFESRPLLFVHISKIRKIRARKLTTVKTSPQKLHCNELTRHCGAFGPDVPSIACKFRRNFNMNNGISSKLPKFFIKPYVFPRLFIFMITDYYFPSERDRARTFGAKRTLRDSSMAEPSERKKLIEQIIKYH